ncbi:MAG TPA: hypothetical protein ACQGQH_00200 [Xylella sp.]
MHALCTRADPSAFNGHHSRQARHHLLNEMGHPRPSNTLALLREIQKNTVPEARFPDFTAHFEQSSSWINNTSNVYPSRLDQVSQAPWEDLFTMNAKVPSFRHTKATQPQGTVINLTDMALNHYTNIQSYCHTALELLSRSRRLSLRPQIQVKLIRA